ncbi:fatty acid CoA ligase Acsl3-like [Dermacentor andersoni]|uniref:fatty acid CoA ligase Acsl3-like n=1 Tax=Dermacentor andersoni TaxID=34620 RepID=UPI002155B472|nr:fatty acid CoA ligase Acsl3-like [Dermacentor andersoni]
MFPFVIEILLCIVKVLGTIYDVVTLPVYTVLQQPWVYWKRKRMCFAKPIIEGDPSSPYHLLRNSEVENLKGVQTLDELVRRAIRSHAKRPALGTRRVLGRRDEVQPNGKVFKKLVLGEYEWLTYEEVDRKVDLTARGLLSIGARPRQFVAILAETRAEWLLTAQACFRTNIPLVTLYATLSNDDIVSAVNVTEVTHLVTSSDLLTRVVSIVAKMPSLTHIVCMESPNAKPPGPFAKGPQVIPFSSLEERGAKRKLEECSPSPDDVAIVMFTSGSLGRPKGVMVLHRNLVSALNGFAVVCDQFGAYTSDDAYLACLPLAHVLELVTETLLFGAGARIGYSSPLTITDNSTAVAKGCRGDVTLLQPTLMVCVPLIVDRLRKGVNEVAASKGPVFKALFDYAVQYKNFWLDLGFDTPLLNQLVFKHVRLLLGPNLKVLACGSAPLSSYTRQFVRACMGCRVIEGYGTTETNGGGSFMNADDASADRVGAPLPGCYIKLVDWDEGNYRTTDKPNPRGEVVVGGPCVAKGYFKDDELTKEFFTEEGGIRWFYSGDIGEIFPDGTLKIVDRKKDLVKLQFGEYISLGRVESVLKTCPLVDNMFVYGNSLRTYLVALVAPNYKHLQRIARELGRGDDVSDASLRELCQDNEVAKAAEEEILAYARSSDLLKTEVPARVKLCAEEWTPDSGLVTATYKIRRKPLQTFYQRDIDAMYGPSEESKLRRA